MTTQEFNFDQPENDEFEKKLQRLESVADRLDGQAERIEMEVREAYNRVVRDVSFALKNEIGRTGSGQSATKIAPKPTWRTKIPAVVQLSFVVSLLCLGIFNLLAIRLVGMKINGVPSSTISNLQSEPGVNTASKNAQAVNEPKKDVVSEKADEKDEKSKFQESDSPELKKLFRDWLFAETNAATMAYIMYHYAYGKTNRSYLFEGDQHEKLDSLSAGGAAITGLKADELGTDTYEKLLYNAVVHNYEKSINENQINKDNWNSRRDQAVERFNQFIKENCSHFEKALPGTADFRRLMIMYQISISTDKIWSPQNLKLKRPTNPCPNPN